MLIPKFKSRNLRFELIFSICDIFMKYDERFLVFSFFVYTKTVYNRFVFLFFMIICIRGGGQGKYF